MSPKSPHEPEPEAALETLSRGQADRVSAFGAELVGVWAATGTIQHQNFKRQSVPHWPFLISETKHQWNKSRKRLLPVQASWCTTSVWQVAVFSLQGSGASSLIEEAVLITHPAASAQNSGVRLTFLPSSLVLASLPYQSMPFVALPPSPPEQGTFVCIKGLLRQTSFLSDFLNVVWELVCCPLVSRSCYFCYLVFIFQAEPLSNMTKPSFAGVKFSNFRSFSYHLLYVAT